MHRRSARLAALAAAAPAAAAAAPRPRPRAARALATPAKQDPDVQRRGGPRLDAAAAAADSAAPEEDAQRAKKTPPAKRSKPAAGPTKDLENSYRDENGHGVVAGVDEAGRGPLAGPVVAAACVVPPHVFFDGVGDSKIVSETDRERLFTEITSHPEVLYSITEAQPAEIDEYNILQATLRAMSRAVAGLAREADAVLVDGPHLPKDLPDTVLYKEAVVRGDSKVYAIACASILAKVTRDRIMVDLDKLYPVYGFAKHKGYPTAAHRAAVATHGPSKVHRFSYAPVRLAAEAQRLRQKAQGLETEENPDVVHEKEPQISRNVKRAAAKKTAAKTVETQQDLAGGANNKRKKTKIR